MIKQLNELYERDYAKYVKVAVGRGTKAQDAEDVVQEAFTRAITYAGGYDSSRPLVKWFNTILNNAIRDKKSEIKMDGMVRNSKDDDLFTDGEDDFKKRLCSSIEREMEGRSQSHRSIIYLYFMNGYKPREICKIVEDNIQNIYKVLGRFKLEMEVKYG